MGSLAGAKAAIRQRLEERWTSTRITVPNEMPAEPWPPRGAPDPEAPDFAVFAPWVHLEIATLPAAMRGAGRPGHQVWVTDGFIYVHVFVPAGSGDQIANQYADEIGEIFRGALFYNHGDGCYVRSWAPRSDEGGDATTAADQGNWFRVTMSCPFQYWHRG